MTGHTRTSRRRYRGGYLFLGCAIAALAMGGCTADPGTDDGGKDSSAGEPADKSSDGADVEVVDKAVTTTEDSSGTPMVSYAVIVENSSADIATATRLEVRLLDKAGDPVKDLVADNDVFNTAANLVMPGEKQAVTNATYNEGGEVASIEVKASGTAWYSGDDERFSAVTAGDVTVETSGGDEAKISFRAESAYEDELSTVATYAVLRDADGKLLGGTAPNDAEPTAYEPGSSDGTIEVSSGLPPKWDADATEVYVDPLVDA